MPHDTHTTHEPDRVGRAGDELAPDADLDPKVKLLMLGEIDETNRFAADPGDLAPAAN